MQVSGAFMGAGIGTGAGAGAGVGTGAGDSDYSSAAFLHGAVDLQHPNFSDGDGSIGSNARDRDWDRDRRSFPARGSFDEPIASAMRTVLDYSGQSPPVLPMLPNGAPPGTAIGTLSVLHTLPMHAQFVAAGVNEGLGRIRREIGRGVRGEIIGMGPGQKRQGAGRRASEGAGRHVPLEFDEEDEAVFMESGEVEGDHEDHESVMRDDADGSGSGSGASVSVSTPSTRSRDVGLVAAARGIASVIANRHGNTHDPTDPNADPNANDSNINDPNSIGDLGDADTDSMWDAWDDEARAAIAEAETFHEISATGFMDEEQRMGIGVGMGMGKGNRPF